MSEKILVTTTGKDDENQIIISDLSGSPIMNHPTENLDLTVYNSKDEILASAEFQSLVKNGFLLAKDENGVSLLRETNPLDKIGKELLLSNFQVEGSEHSIKQATIFTLLDLPIANDTFTITDGTVTETYTFKASAGSDFEVTIGANPLASMTNLVAKINSESALWRAKVEQTWDISNNDYLAVVLTRILQTNTSYVDRIFGEFTTQEDCVYINFNNQIDYSKTETSTLPVEDPEIKTFGFGRKEDDLEVAETHKIRNFDTVLMFDVDQMGWVNLQGTRHATGTITGDGTEDTFDIEHELNTEYIQVSLWADSTGTRVPDADYTVTKKSGVTAKTVTIVFDTPPLNNATYKVFITGATAIN